MQDSGIPTTRADLQSLIDSRIEENWSLEYKAAGALNRENPKLRDEMTKDISAFANAAGGTLIYGIKEYNEAEKRHLPSIITPINAKEYSREWLDQMVGQIQPRIDGLRIIPLHVGPNDSDFCYVVVVPQSGTAHQATDKRYYKRRNFEVSVMEDYEIRDVMNRRKHPRISVLLRIVRLPNSGNYQVFFRIKNEGSVMARHFSLEVLFPYDLGNSPIAFADPATFHVDEKEGYWRFSVGNGIGPPLFPQASFSCEKLTGTAIKLTSMKVHSISEIRITAYADSMEPTAIKKDPGKALLEWV